MRKEAADGTADRSRLDEDLAEARERLLAEESAQVCLLADDKQTCCEYTVLLITQSLLDLA